MPQADLLTFQPTMLFLPITFLLGYFFFVTQWVPRIMLTLKARAWLTRYEVALASLVASDSWPEIFLMFVQFAGLVYVLSKLTLVTHSEESALFPLRYTPPAAVSFTQVGGLPIENFFFLWGSHRQTFFYAPAASELSRVTTNVLNQFTFFSPGKQFPFLLIRLKKKLALATAKLSEVNSDHNRG